MIQIYLFVVTPAMLYLAFKRGTENERIQKSHKNKSEKEKSVLLIHLRSLIPTSEGDMDNLVTIQK